MDTSRYQTEGPVHSSSESHKDSNLSPRLPSNRPLQAPGSVGPSSGGNPARRFHPDHPGFLHVGHRRSDKTDVWLSTPQRDPSFQRVFYDQNLTKVSEKELDFDWLDEFKVNNFPGSTTARQGEVRRLRLYQIICANRDNDTTTQDGPAAMDQTETVPEPPFKTLLVVSANNHSNYAPFYVELLKQGTILDLFESLLDECKYRGQAADTASTIKATFLWDGRVRLLRKDNPEGWTIFWEDLREAWERKRDYFIENDCEIEMILLAEAA